MKVIKELKTKNSNAQLITLAKSCTCSTCFKKIKAGTKFLRIKNKLLGTLNYCSAECMQHPMIRIMNASEDCCIIPTEDTHATAEAVRAYTELYEAEMKNLNLPENIDDSFLNYLTDPNIGISDYDYSYENLHKLLLPLWNKNN